MARLLVGLVSILFFVYGHDAVFWSDLRMKFNFDYPVGGGYTRLPKTAREAKANNWVSDSVNCTNNEKYYGYRYTDYTDPYPEFVGLLYDVQGVIAGIQVLVPQIELTFNSSVRFDTIPQYQPETIDGVDYFVITVYFVDPERICNGGRPESALETEGTGTDVLFQNGSPHDLIKLPHARADAVNGDFGDNACVRHMGNHSYHQIRKWGLNNCETVSPAFAIYNLDGELDVFGFNILSKLSSPKFETTTSTPVLKALEYHDPFPQCLYDLNTRVGAITTLHIYFVDEPWKKTCGPGATQ